MNSAPAETRRNHTAIWSPPHVEAAGPSERAGSSFFTFEFNRRAPAMHIVSCRIRRCSTRSSRESAARRHRGRRRECCRRPTVSGIPGAGDLTGLQDVGAIGAGQRLLRVLLDQQHGGALRVDLGDDLEDLRDHHRRQPHRGLVEQQHLRPGHQRPADREHLLLAAGQRAADLLRRSASRGKVSSTQSSRSLASAFDANFARSNPFRGSPDGHAGEDAAALRRLDEALDRPAGAP